MLTDTKESLPYLLSSLYQKSGYKSIAALARAAMMTEASYTHRLLSGERTDPSNEMAKRLARALADGIMRDYHGPDALERRTERSLRYYNEIIRRRDENK